GLSPISSAQVRRLQRTWWLARSCVDDGSRVLERLQSGDEFVQVGIAVAVEGADVDRSFQFDRPPEATVEDFPSGIHDSGVRSFRIAKCPDQTSERQMGKVASPERDRPRVDQPHSWHLWHGELSSAGLGTGSSAAASPTGMFRIRCHCGNENLVSVDQVSSLQPADNSSITIVCCSAVSDCGNLIKTTRLAVPSPAR